jgi:transposase InsO family protein
MSQRYEFAILAAHSGVNFTELCRRYGISRKTGYKWFDRFSEGGAAALEDQLRRPRCSPKQCPEAVADKVLKLRAAHPAWGGRKLRRRLQDLGHEDAPAASTCTEILRRAGKLEPEATAGHRPMQRFERAMPNQLWQLDFKGDFATQSGVRCHALTMLDDHSRYNLSLTAAGDQTTMTVRTILTEAFAQNGLPEAILCDNGAPWGSIGSDTGHTALTVWLLRLGVRVLHGRPYHPQTQGKEERFHRTLEAELLSRHTWRDLAHCTEQFVRFRHIYNCERPHDALAGATPISRYRPSPRSLPETLPPIEYTSGVEVRTVREKGVITFRGQTWLIGRAFASLPIGLRPSAQADGQWDVLFSFHTLGRIDLTTLRDPRYRVRPLLPSLPRSTPPPS